MDKLVEELRNEKRVEFESMSEASRSTMLTHHDLVEWWNSDFMKWTKPVTAKENWKNDAYRLVMEEGVILVSEHQRSVNVDELSLEQARRMAQVCLDLHHALGVEWGDNPYRVIDKLQENRDLVYLATPFVHADPKVMEKRFAVVTRFAADMMIDGVHVFSPITHCYPMAKERGLPRGYDFWSDYDRKMLMRCSKMIVLMQEGWEKSEGVTREIALAQSLGIPIEYAKVEDSHV